MAAISTHSLEDADVFWQGAAEVPHQDAIVGGQVECIPVIDCGMGLGHANEDTLREWREWREGVEGGLVTG